MNDLKKIFNQKLKNYKLINARIPSGFFTTRIEDAEKDHEGSLLVDLIVENDKITNIEAAKSTASETNIDLEGRYLWPKLIDAHAHLDKGHIFLRTPNLNGTFDSAWQGSNSDRVTYWTHEDVTRRMDFSLRIALAHGVGAIRTHLESHPETTEIPWKAFAEIREKYAPLITLQAASLVPIDVYGKDDIVKIANIVADTGGILGGVSRASGSIHTPDFDITPYLDRLFELARERDLDIDLHVDESADSHSLPDIARATIKHGYEGRVNCGHCCSLANLSEKDLDEHLTLAKDAGLSFVSLPTVNMYLQDRTKGRTPRWRGVMPIVEMNEKGLKLAIGGDNCRDPFYAYGDHDMVDTFRQAVKIAHLDYPSSEYTKMVGKQPASIMGLNDVGVIKKDMSANFIIMNAWSMDQIMARPQSDRLVVTNGALGHYEMPSYQELADIVKK